MFKHVQLLSQARVGGGRGTRGDIAFTAAAISISCPMGANIRRWVGGQESSSRVGFLTIMRSVGGHNKEH